MRILLAVAMMCLTVPAAADAPAAAPSPAKPVKEKRLCRQEQVIGSIIPAHICLTKAQWIEFEKHYEDVDQSFIARRKDHFNATPSKSGQIEGVGP
jgi:hypothetical protein